MGPAGSGTANVGSGAHLLHAPEECHPKWPCSFLSSQVDWNAVLIRLTYNLLLDPILIQSVSVFGAKHMNMIQLIELALSLGLQFCRFWLRESQHWFI